MKRLAIAIVILILGTLPAAAESVSTYPVRGAKLDAMVGEILDWVEQHMEPAVESPPKIVFVEKIGHLLEKLNHEYGDDTQWDPSTMSVGFYDPNIQTVYLRDDWFGRMELDIEILAHELVHYTRHMSGDSF